MAGDSQQFTADESPPGSGVDGGVRVVAERPSAEGPPWRYAGNAIAYGRRFELVVTLDEAGSVQVSLSPDPPPGLADRVRLLMRAAWRHASAEKTPPPRRIARWRAWRPAVLASPT